MHRSNSIGGRDELIQEATECLDTISHGSTKDATLLYACVLEAQQIGDQPQIVAALQRVLQKYDYNAPAEVHLPALLRFANSHLLTAGGIANGQSCTARLLVREIEQPSSQITDGIDEICKLFEGG